MLPQNQLVPTALYLVAVDGAHSPIDMVDDRGDGWRLAADVVDVVGVHYSHNVPELVGPPVAAMEPGQVLGLLEDGNVCLHSTRYSRMDVDCSRLTSCTPEQFIIRLPELYLIARYAVSDIACQCK